MVYNETKFSVSRFNADSAPQPEGLRCVSVFIPDDTFHLRLLAGLVGLATKATNWEGEQVNRDAVALLWNMAYDATDWGECMDCGDVQNCIETDDGVKGAIINEVNNAIQNNETTINSILQMLQNQNSPGNPMTNSGDSITPPGTFETDDVCDLDKLWSGCLYLSEYLDQLITDFFEQIAELTEAAKIVAKASGAIPVLGDYIQSALEFALALQEKVAVTYTGEQSEEVIQDIACDFFCRAQINCGLSVDDVIDVISTRLGEISPAEFGSVIEVMITGTFEGVQIVEVAYLLALSAIKFGQQFGDALGVRPISDIMRIGASDPADAWMVICDTCVFEWECASPLDIAWEDWTLPDFSGAQTTIVDDDLVGAENTSLDANFLNAEYTVDADVTKVEFDIGWIDAGGGNAAIIYQDNVNVASIVPTGTGEATVTWEGTASGSHTWRLLIGINGGTEATRYTVCHAARFSGTGDSPCDA